MNKLDAIQVNDPNNLDEVFAAMRDEMLSGQEYPLQPITLPEPRQSVTEETTEQQHYASVETVTEAVREADTTSTVDAMPDVEHEFDFSMIDNPRQNPNIGLFTIKTANDWMVEAKSEPERAMLFGQLWSEGEVCYLFADTNLGKSILAVQIGEAISGGHNYMNMPMMATPQSVLYFDFELSKKQFEGRYVNDRGCSHRFSDNFMRLEINPDVEDIPDGLTFEDFLKQSMMDVVAQTGTRVVIVDNLTYLTDQMEKAKDALPLMKWLRQFAKKMGLSMLVLGHTPKRNLQNPITQNDLQGSKMLMNFCDSSFAIGKSTREDCVRYIKEIKQRNAAFMYGADNVIVCEIVKPDDFVHFRFIGYGKESDHLREINDENRGQIIAAAKDMKADGKSVREIASELGIAASTVSKYLNQ